MRREALQIDSKYYGEDHPEVAADLANLATLFTEMVGPQAFVSDEEK